MITSLQMLDLEKVYSYADYITWRFSERVELLKGYIFKMAAPTPTHQRILVRLLKNFSIFFDKQSCEVFVAPFDVRLYNRKKSILTDKEVYTVVQPDICVICDKNKIDNKGCNGSPELIIEILSPSNSKTDLKDKFALYQETGVQEYWIVYPEYQIIHQYFLEEERYVFKGVFTKDEKISPILFADLEIDLNEVFDF